MKMLRIRSSLKNLITKPSLVTIPCFILPSTVRCFSCSKTLALKQNSFLSKRNRNFTLDSIHGGAFIVRGLSSFPAPHTVEFNDSASCSGVDNNSGNVIEEDIRASIPVRAYFISTRFVACFFT